MLGLLEKRPASHFGSLGGKPTWGLKVAVLHRAMGDDVCNASFPSSHFPFCPQTCNASFATRDRLRSHLACHEDKVPCQVCGKYLRAAYMADHLKKHSEGPGNFCSICNRGNLPADSSLPEEWPERKWEARAVSPTLPQCPSLHTQASTSH